MKNSKIIEILNSLTEFEEKHFIKYLDDKYIPYTVFTNGTKGLSFSSLKGCLI